MEQDKKPFDIWEILKTISEILIKQYEVIDIIMQRTDLLHDHVAKLYQMHIDMLVALNRSQTPATDKKKEYIN